MSKKKPIEFAKKNPQRAVDLFRNLIYFFPYNPELLIIYNTEVIQSNFNNEDRKQSFYNDIVINSIDLKGFMNNFKIRNRRSDFALSPNTSCGSISDDITNSVFKMLQDLPQQPNSQDKYVAGPEFQALSFFFKLLFRIIASYDIEGGWKKKIVGKKIESQFYSIFRIWPHNINSDNIFTSKEFVSALNSILEMFFGDNTFILFEDGTFWYTDSSEESHEEFLAIRALTKRRMTKVVKDINDLREFMLNGDYNKALWQCRVTTEDFLKDLLINNKIKSITTKTKKKKIKDASLNELIAEFRKNISKILRIPKYYNTQPVSDGFDHFLQSLGSIISGITNNFSHGKGTPGIQSTSSDAQSTFSFLIGSINLLLAYEK